MADNSKRRKDVEEEYRELDIDTSTLLHCYSKGPSGFSSNEETEED